MPSLTLWLEITISGSFYLASILLLSLRLLKITDIAFLASLKDYLAAISIIAVVFSYLLGILAHRLIPLLLGVPARRLGKTLKHHELMKAGAKMGQDYPSMVKVWQYGSTRLHQEMNIQWSLLALFMSLVFGLPIFGFSLAIWLYSTSAKILSIPVFILCLLLGIGFFMAFLRQQRTFNMLSRAAFEEMEKVKANQAKS